MVAFTIRNLLFLSAFLAGSALAAPQGPHDPPHGPPQDPHDPHHDPPPPPPHDPHHPPPPPPPRCTFSCPDRDSAGHGLKTSSGTFDGPGTFTCEYDDGKIHIINKPVCIYDGERGSRTDDKDDGHCPQFAIKNGRC